MLAATFNLECFLWLEGVTHEETEMEEVLSQLGPEELGASDLKPRRTVNVHLSIGVLL